MKTLLPSVLLAWSFVCSSFALAADAVTPPAPPTPSSPRPFAVIAPGNPRSVAVDRAGNLYVGDVDLGKVLKITPAGVVSAAVVAGASLIHAPIGLAMGPNDTVFVADADDAAIYQISSNGTATALPQPAGDAAFNIPTSVTVDAAGNVFVANNGNNLILKITPAGAASVFAGHARAQGAADGPGSDARFNTPRGLAVDGQNNLYVADEGNSNIRKITPAGMVSTLAGAAGQSGMADGAGLAASFGGPHALAADPAGTVYVADTQNHCIRKITPAGVVTTFAGLPGKAGNADGQGRAARFSEPRGIAVDAAGNVYVADTGNGAIRQITPDGVVTTIAAPAPPSATTAAAPAVSFAPAPAPILPPRTGPTERFDYSHAQTLDGWVGDPRYWSVHDGAFTAKGERVQSNFLLTQKKFSDFRLTLSAQVVVSTNHAGVCLWGEQVALANGKNPWAYKGPLLMFPGLGIWDYVTDKNIPVDPAGKILAKKIAGQHDWIRLEMLAQANRLRVAYNGRQVLDWREPDPARLKDGPIGLQLHGFTLPQQVIYKDVVIETFPKEDRLITLNPPPSP